MSADSPKRTTRCVPSIVPPQAVSDRSIIDSVAGFINDVTLTNQQQGDPKDTILWARFESTSDISDPTFGEDWELEGGIAPPLLLILGYVTGLQVWAIPANGEAVEVLSWRHGSVKALRILPTPISAEYDGTTDQVSDQFAHKRPLMAICDSSSANCGLQCCSVNFISLKDGDQVKTIKFKNPVVDILANRSAVVVTFTEKIAVFDARNLEDRLTVTSCHTSPGINPNPVALGSRWMAYADRKLLTSKRSSGGCDREGAASYTATVLNAAKSLGKGLRELTEHVTAGFTGNTSGGGSCLKSNNLDGTSANNDQWNPGMVTIMDIKHPIKEVSPTTGAPISSSGADPVIAHFAAHSDAIVALEFDNSGMLLVTADKRGNDFHVFRIQSHPGGPSLAAVHHLYILHRGDTSAKVQDVCFSLDSRWVAVSSLRGTTHVFPITTYGGPAGVRTHGNLHVVNRLSRFHRSAGLSVDGRSNSPVFQTDSSNQYCLAYTNPRTPPFPRPTIVNPLAQLRQPSMLGTPPGSANNSYSKAHGRQRVSSLSDDTSKPVRVCAIFAKARSWLLEPPNVTRETPGHKIQRKAIDSLFVMAGHGALIQYDLDVKHISNVAKEKVCDDTAIELEVEAKAQWNLIRSDSSTEIQPPLPSDNWLLKDRLLDRSDSDDHSVLDKDGERDDRWLSQVEIITYAGPHRRLWMGPQFIFKTYNTPSGAPLSHIDIEAVEIGVASTGNRPARSNPMNMPLSTSARTAVPVLIESGSCSSFEQSPRLMDKFRHEHMDSDFSHVHGDSQLREDLADAMRESPAGQTTTSGSMLSSSSSSSTSARNKSFKGYESSNSAIHSCSENQQIGNLPSTSGVLSGGMTSAHSHQQQTRSVVLVEKVVNPLGTVTTITHSASPNSLDDQYMDFVDDYIIHENCDESLFRPVVAIMSGDGIDNIPINPEHERPPENIGTELIVPVIDESNYDQMVGINKKLTKQNKLLIKDTQKQKLPEDKEHIVVKFDELSLITKKSKADKKKTADIIKKEKISPLVIKQPAQEQLKKLPFSCENENFSFHKTYKSPLLLSSSGSEKKKDIATIPTTITRKSEKKELKNTQKTEKAAKKLDTEKKGSVVDSLCVDSSLSTNKEILLKINKLGSDNSDKSSQFEVSNLDDMSQNLTLSEEEVQRNCADEVKDDDLEKYSCKQGENKKTEKLVKEIVKKCSVGLIPQAKHSSISDIKLPKKQKGILSNLSNTYAEVPTTTQKSKKEKPSSKSKAVQLPTSFQQEAHRDNEGEIVFENSLESEVEKNEGKQYQDTCSKHITQTEERGENTITFWEKFGHERLKSPNNELLKGDTKQQDAYCKLDEFPSLTIDTKKSKKTKNVPTLQTDLTEKIKKEKFENDNFDNDPNTTTFTFTTKKKLKKPYTDEGSIKKCIPPEFSEDIKIDDLVYDFPTPQKEKSLAGKVSKSKTIKTKNTQKIPTESVNADIFEPPYLPPLSALEPFEPTFDSLYFDDDATTSEPISLINFESPLQELRENIVLTTKSCTEKAQIPVASDSKHEYTEANLIFALCGSLHEAQSNTESQVRTEEKITQVKSDETTTRTKMSPKILPASVKMEQKSCNLKGKNNYKSIEALHEIDDQYLSLELQSKENTSSSSSEETEESSCNLNKKKHAEIAEDDEELRPLIGDANSTCSMTASSAICKNDEHSIALEIAKTITDTLPDNNESDSSDQGNNARQLECPDIDDDLCTDDILKSASGSSADEAAGQKLPSSRQGNQDSANTTEAASFIGTPISGNQQSGKKKSKKKKR